MISIENQQKLFLNIGQLLNKRVTVYAVGGTAMMFWGFKDATLDIDLVFSNAEDRTEFINTIKNLGYALFDECLVYGRKCNSPVMYKRDDERFDLFLYEVIQFFFSQEMQMRATKTYEFDKLILKVTDPHDIILMKCATDRAKDMDDARKILSTYIMSWEILLAESKNQINLGKTIAAFELGSFLEKMKDTYDIPIPKEVIDSLWEIVMQQMKEKTRDN